MANHFDKCFAERRELFETSFLICLHWTDSKTDLVELIYSIKDSIGGGKASVKQITTCFEYFFDIKLGNIYDVINDISLRKINRTKYIDKIKVNFQKVLDQMDA